MRFLLCLFFYCFLGFAFSQTIRNVRIVDHASYIIGLIQKSVDQIQKNHWNGLKFHNVTIEINEEILSKIVQGTVTFNNGFIVSMQRLTLLPSTIQQSWLYTRSTNTTTLELRCTMQITDMTIGYYVDGTINGEKYHNTGTMLYPVTQFQLALIRNLYTDKLSSRAIPVLPRTANRMKFLPTDEYSDILSHLKDPDKTNEESGCCLLDRFISESEYKWNSTFSSIETWAKEVFAPMVLDVAETEHPIPIYCYDCPVQ